MSARLAKSFLRRVREGVEGARVRRLYYGIRMVTLPDFSPEAEPYGSLPALFCSRRFAVGRVVVMLADHLLCLMPRTARVQKSATVASLPLCARLSPLVEGGESEREGERNRVFAFDSGAPAKRNAWCG